MYFRYNIYILDLPASRKTCSTCFSMGDFRQDRRFCCFQATLQQSVCYSQKIYIGMHTLSYNTLSYNTHTLVQYSFVSVLYFWFFLIHLWFMYQFIGINASSVSIISPCLTPADSPQRRRKRERCSETGSCRWLTGDAPGVEVMGVAKLPKNGPKSLRKVLQKGLNRPKWWNKPGKFDPDSICNIFCFLAGKDVQQRCFGPLHKRPKLDTLVLCSWSPPGTKPHSLALKTQNSSNTMKLWKSQKVEKLAIFIPIMSKKLQNGSKVVQFQKLRPKQLASMHW
jgi:hypothetical protein